MAKLKEPKSRWAKCVEICKEMSDVKKFNNKIFVGVHQEWDKKDHLMIKQEAKEHGVLTRTVVSKGFRGQPVYLLYARFNNKPELKEMSLDWIEDCFTFWD